MSEVDATLFRTGLPPGRARALPPATVALASLLGAAPFVAHVPLAPPLGLLMLLAWRLLAPASLRIWSPAPLGLLDDLVSGQPLGSAVLLWSLSFLAIDAIERRLLYRDTRQDWGIAALVVAFCLIAGRFLASPVSAPVDLVLVAQVMASVLLFPLAARLVAWIDRKRMPS